MPRALADLLQILARLIGQGVVAQRQAVEADDRVHGRADLMAHIGEEGGLGFIGLLCGFQRFAESVAARHRLAHLGVDDRQSQTDRVNNMIVTILRMTDARHTDHLIVLSAVALGQIAEGDDRLVEQPSPDVIGIDKIDEVGAVLFIDKIVGII